MRLLGYAWVSTSDQSATAQCDALSAAGCEHVWADIASGARADRPALNELLAAATAGDTVTVTRLDRLGRSLPHLLSLVEDLAARNVGLRSLAEKIDTTSATGRLVLHVFGALAEFRRGLNRMRTLAGLTVAQARGRVGGRPRSLTATQLSHAQALAAAGTPVRETADLLSVGRSTLYRSLQQSQSEEVGD
jgi:DNA invertase Pin-like site-specific DNA recombinase